MVAEKTVGVSFASVIGTRLVGAWHLPAGASHPPVVAFAHGFGSGRSSARNEAVVRELVSKGIAAFTFDFTGHGESEGRRDEATLDRMIGDLAAAVHFVRMSPDVDGRRLGIHGSSSGALVAAAYAMEDRDIRALVLRGLPADQILKHASNIRVPTLVLVGSEDLAFAEEDRRFAESLPAEHAFVAIKGAGHLFDTPEQLAEVIERTTSWFLKHLSDPRRIG